MTQEISPEFEAIFQEHHKALIGLSYNIVRDKDSAKDVVQEVFANLWKNRASITFGSQIRHYLFKATAHASLNHLRYQRRLYRLDDFKELTGIVENNATDDLTYEELELKSRQAIDRLPPQCKAIFILSRQEGLKYKEIADTLGISLKTVENQMGIALEKLRSDLKPFINLETFSLLLVVAALLYKIFS